MVEPPIVSTFTLPGSVASFGRAAAVLRTALCFCWLWAVASCATPESNAAHLAPPADISTQTPRKIPEGHYEFSNGDNYPEQAKRQRLAGRVLVEFQIDPHGRPVSEKVVAADAASVLQSAALAAVRKYTFDVSGPGFDAGDPTPFRVTVWFCILKCDDTAPFPGTRTYIVITGSPP